MLDASNSSLKARSLDIQPFNPCDAEDLETSRLIAQLTLDDITRIDLSRKGKAREDASLTDEELAFLMQRGYWEGIMRALEDRQIAEGLAAAMEVDRSCLRVLAVVEQAAQDDRCAALALSENRPLPSVSEAQRMMEDPIFFAPLEE